MSVATEGAVAPSLRVAQVMARSRVVLPMDVGVAASAVRCRVAKTVTGLWQTVMAGHVAANGPGGRFATQPLVKVVARVLAAIRLEAVLHKPEAPPDAAQRARPRQPRPQTVGHAAPFAPSLLVRLVRVASVPKATAVAAGARSKIPLGTEGHS